MPGSPSTTPDLMNPSLPPLPPIDSSAFAARFKLRVVLANASVLPRPIAMVVTSPGAEIAPISYKTRRRVRWRLGLRTFDAWSG